MTILSSTPYFPEESLNTILNEIKLVLQSRKLTDGPFTQEFETRFAEYIKVKYAVAVNSGTSALDVALRSLKLDGREVIVPTNTFVSTPNTVIFAGGKPIFADMKENTLCVDLDAVRRKLSPKTAGIIVVHIGGLVCPEINEIKELCDEKDLFLLEDSAHAHGAMIDGKMAGALSDAGCFSFYPTKVMTSCEGGMITTNNPELAQKARCLREVGQDAEKKVVMLGYNWRINELGAVVGRNQLRFLEEFVVKRNEVAKWYEEALNGITRISLFRTPLNIRHSYYKYPIRLDENIDRLKLAALLKEKYGIETGHVYYPPCHLQPYYMQNFGTRLGDYPVAEKVLNKVLCLPMHFELTKENVDYICESLVSSMSELC